MKFKVSLIFFLFVLSGILVQAQPKYSWQEIQRDFRPSHRQGFSMETLSLTAAQTTPQRILLLYGGNNGARALGGLFYFDTQNLFWQEIDLPAAASPLNSESLFSLHYQKFIVIGNSPESIGSRPAKEPFKTRGINTVYFYELIGKKGNFSVKLESFYPDLGPEYLISYAAATDKNEHIVLFGGKKRINGKYQPCSELWIFNIEKRQWFSLDFPAGPSARSRAVMHYMGYGRYLLFGGESENNKILSDIWLLDLEFGKWQKIDVKLPFQPRLPDFSANFSWKGKYYLLVYGGLENDTIYQDLWLFSLEDKKWIKVKKTGEKAPDARSFGGLSLLNNETPSFLLFGGGKNGPVYNFYNDIWKLDLKID